MSHGGPTRKGLLMFVGVVGICAALSMTFYYFYMKSVSTLMSMDTDNELPLT